MFNLGVVVQQVPGLYLDLDYQTNQEKSNSINQGLLHQTRKYPILSHFRPFLTHNDLLT